MFSLPKIDIVGNCHVWNIWTQRRTVPRPTHSIIIIPNAADVSLLLTVATFQCGRDQSLLKNANGTAFEQWCRSPTTHGCDNAKDLPREIGGSAVGFFFHLPKLIPSTTGATKSSARGEHVKVFRIRDAFDEFGNSIATGWGRQEP